MNYNYIAIEGNIGAGKTTLAKMLAEHYQADLLLERFEDNPFLPKFYKEPDRYAFPLELSFLADRYHQLSKYVLGPNLFSSLTVSDYFLSKSLIFAKTTLSDDEYRLFCQLFEIMFQSVPKPDLMVYLYTPIEKLRQNIQKRGRNYEKEIKSDYLQRIQSQYLDFLRKHGDQMRILLIDTSDLDFVANSVDFQQIVENIEKPLSEGVHRQVV
jgi:deoxyadenosine/deoxycytidine kinase